MSQTSEIEPFFSIITITLNNLNGLKETQKSIEKQKLTDFEWIIIDGKSDDGTKPYLKTLSARTISETDNGIYDAMNKGLKIAKGQYVLFLNAGDSLAEPETLINIHASADDQDFIYGDSLEALTAEETRHKPARSPNIVNGMFTHHQAMLYRRKALKNLKYNEHYKIAADYDFTARFLQKSKDILYIQKPLCVFQSGGVSQTKAPLGRKEQYEIRKALKLCTPFKNVAIFIVQTVLWNIRKTAPALYWHLKSFGNKAAGSSQTTTPPRHP